MNGTRHPVAAVLAKASSDSAGRPGLTVCFFDETAGCGDPISRKNRVEVFFPKNDSSYGAPSSIAFRLAGGKSVAETSTTGYEGGITSFNPEASTVKGRVKIQKVGFDEDSSIEADFNAVFCPP